ncbi:MAG: DUF2007 domain-containing protein [Tidjanibacter sp.]|nr:DUF2007 domain-containing protein [Tidjanibacter sp.]
MRENEIVVLNAYNSAYEANLAASMLRSMGVEVEIAGDIATNVLPQVGENIVRLLVNAGDYERAVALLNQEPDE